MAKTIEQLENKLRIKFLVHQKKYYLFFGSMCVLINNEYQLGFNTFEECKSIGIKLKPTNYRNRFIF